MNKYSLSALAAAGLLAGSFATGANAADLGGNCCADLEERIAELEATTARKGNRKVSLTITGWVAESVTYWDDGHESNVYVGGIGTTLGTNVKFTGQATIVPGWTAGYLIHIEADGSDSLAGTNAGVDNGPGLFAGTANYVQTLQSYWFIKSDQLGKVSVGLQSMVSDNAVILVDGSGSLVVANNVAFDVGGFQFRNSANNALTGQTILTGGACIPGDCFGVPQNAVRYDSPTFAGFSASASWGEDDVWDVGIRYAGELGGFKLAATVVYAESTDIAPTLLTNQEQEYLQAGAYIQHIGTGLWFLYNYTDLDDTSIVNSANEGESHYFKAGIRQRWNPLGHTVLYGEYLTSEDESTADGEFEWWGVGAVQEVDNAAMSVWVKYRQFEFDDNTGVNYDDFDQFTVGGLINF